MLCSILRKFKHCSEGDRDRDQGDRERQMDPEWQDNSHRVILSRDFRFRDVVTDSVIKINYKKIYHWKEIID